MLMLKFVLAWFPMILIAIANGALREFSYGKQVSELRAHQLSTLSALTLFSIYIGIVLRVWRPESASQAFAIGLIWLILTVAFEFLFGHYISGFSWSRLLRDYNLLAGRVWIFIPIWIALAPLVFYQAQQ
jgi:hypothetical protein